MRDAQAASGASESEAGVELELKVEFEVEAASVDSVAIEELGRHVCLCV